MLLITVTEDDPLDDELREITSRFMGPARNERAVVLARSVFELTSARDTYVPGSNSVEFPERLRALNEIQHRVTNRLVDILLGRGWDGADEYVWGVAFETARNAGCIEYVRFGYRQALLA
jgi:hypothetical protein